MLVRKEGMVWGGGRGMGDEVMIGRDRVGRMARYCWDWEDGEVATVWLVLDHLMTMRRPRGAWMTSP